MDKLNTATLAKHTDEELKKIKQFAYMPTGILGVHDFMLGRKMEGVLHIVLTFIVFFFCNGLGEMVCKNVGNCNNSGEIETFYSSTLMLGVLFAIGSYVWALFEGDTINKTIIGRHQPAPKKLSPAKIKQIKAADIKQKRQSKKALGIASLIVGAIASVAPLLSLLILKNTSCAQGGCELSAISIGVFMYVGIPFLAVLALALGLFSIGKKENGKINLLPFLGILLGILGALLAWDLTHGQFLLSALWH